MAREGSSITPRTVGVEGVAEALGIGVTLARELVAKNEIRSIRIGSRRLIPLSEIDRYIEQRMAEE